MIEYDANCVLSYSDLLDTHVSVLVWTVEIAQLGHPLLGVVIVNQQLDFIFIEESMQLTLIVLLVVEITYTVIVLNGQL